MRRATLVTGANGQLGKALIDRLSSQNELVFAVDLHFDSLESPDNVYKYVLDITDEFKVAEFFESEICEFELTGLVNNAGVAVFTPFEERTLDELRFVFDVNIIGTVLMTRAFMRASKNEAVSKSVVSLGSIYGAVAPDLTVYGDTPRMSSEIYGITKAGIINFTYYLASYYRDRNARFNCVSPGGIERDQGPEFKRLYSNRVPLARMAEVSEIASVVAFLLSDEASYVNGENIFVDGGLTKW